MQDNNHTPTTPENYMVTINEYGKPHCLTLSYSYNESLDCLIFQQLIFQYLDCVKLTIYARRKIIDLFPRQLETLCIMKICNTFTVPKTLLSIVIWDCASRDVNILLPKKLRMIDANFNGNSGYDVSPKYLRSVFFSSINTNTNTNANTTLSKSLKHTWFGNEINTCIKLSKNLERVDVGGKFNKFIELPKGLKYLTVGHSFNQWIMLPKYMVYLSAGRQFDQNIVLSESIVGLRFRGNIKFSITDNFPNGLRSLELSYFSASGQHPYSYSTNNLPNGVKMVK